MTLPAVACVIIGRNEGDRLRRCIESVGSQVSFVVYVDSGSTDGSVEMAKAKGATVVALDMGRPFTAARARNEGLKVVTQAKQHFEFVQFVDGDCEIQPTWLERAERFLRSHPQVVAVCGRRRERYPENSTYNMLCDMEWNVPSGAARFFGGDVLIRIDALGEVGGYRDDLIAGEEPELCVRLRSKGWRVEVLAEEMTLHDAAMTRFRQWWTRSLRSGFAFAEGAHLHGAPPERHNVRELRSAMSWGVALPLLILFASILLTPWALAVLLLYPFQVGRLFLRVQGTTRQRRLRAIFLVVGKFAEAQGALRYWRLRFLKRSGGLIEYK
jgi:glycosyltransferase involved in cell wall biosynthesis